MPIDFVFPPGKVCKENRARKSNGMICYLCHMNSPVQNKTELIERIISNQKRIFSFGVMRLGIFGSFARNEVKEKSDVDFFAEIKSEYKTLKNFSALYDYLENLTGRKIEIVTPQSLNKFIGKYILQEVEYVAITA